MRTMCSLEIFTKKCLQQQIFDSDLKGAWHYNHVTFTPIAKNFMLHCILIYMLSILCVRLTIKVKVGIPESFKVGWYPPPPKKLGRVTLILVFSIKSIKSGNHSLYCSLFLAPKSNAKYQSVWNANRIHFSSHALLQCKNIRKKSKMTYLKTSSISHAKLRYFKYVNHPKSRQHVEVHSNLLFSVHAINNGTFPPVT